ncbi:hypothetical protein JHK87_015768 [Glycine soja]|nr:hypothetical protein JHK87_015768 [Glycine soja]
MGQERNIKEEDLTHLPHLQVMIKETFRLYPSTPFSLPHVATESCKIFRYHIPKARDPNEWVDPLEFRPERFLQDDEKAKVDIRGNDFEVIPFGAGRRICVGLSLGLRMFSAAKIAVDSATFRAPAITTTVSKPSCWV